MRSGRFDLELGVGEKAIYSQVNARCELRRVLTAEFGPDGRPRGVTPEQSQWAMRVVADRPGWALPVLGELGFRPRDVPDSGGD